MKKVKLPYKVTINWHGDIKTYDTMAVSEKKALGNACSRLAGELGMHKGAVCSKVKADKDYKVEED